MKADDLETLMPMPRRIERRSGTWRTGKKPAFCLENLESSRISRAVKQVFPGAERGARDADINVRLCLVKKLRNAQRVRTDLLQHAYHISVGRQGVRVEAIAEQGLFYGIQTLKQLLEIFPRSMPCLDILDWPDMTYRGIHCMMGCSMLNYRMTRKCIRRMAEHKMTHVVMEYDNRFPWEKHSILSHPSCFSKDQIRSLIKLAADNFMELTPCLDSLGHAQPYLWPEKHRRFRENPDKINDLCATDPAAMKFMKELWSEVLEVHREAEYAHITGDEVWYLSGGLCRSAGKGGEEKIYRDWYTDLSRWIIDNGKKPIVWCDMMVKHPGILKGFPNDVVIADWCYDNPDLPYNPDNPFFMRVDKKGRIVPEQERIFRKYWMRPGSKTKLENFPYVRFFKDRGFEVIGATASGAGCTLQVPDQRARFVNNKRFAMEIKKRNELGLMATWWTTMPPMESAWAGILACADHSWNSRNESAEAFNNRFCRHFVGAKSSESKAFQLVTDIIARREAECSGYLGKMWFEGKDAEKACETIRKAVLRDSRNREYKDIIVANAEMLAVETRLGRIYNRINKLRIGRGRDIPLDIKRFANRGFRNALPCNVIDAWKMKPGPVDISGVRFRVIDPSRNGGKSVVTTRGLRNPRAPGKIEGIPVGVNADRLFFFYSGYDIGVNNDQHVVDIVIHYESGRKNVFPITEGVNIMDWNRRGGFGKYLPGALVGWAEASKYWYLGWWANPEPDKKIQMLDIVSRSRKGYLILGGITARVDSRNNVSPGEKHNLRDAMARERKSLDRLYRHIDAYVRKTLAPEEARAMYSLKDLTGQSTDGAENYKMKKNRNRLQQYMEYWFSAYNSLLNK